MHCSPRFRGSPPHPGGAALNRKDRAEYMTEISVAIETLERLLRDILAEPPDSIDPDCDMIDAFGLSSVDVMDLVSQVEDTWDIAFPLNDLASIRTLRQLAERVQALDGAR